MRAAALIGGVAATVCTIAGSLAVATPASASNFGVELEGTYRVVSDGEWAKGNEVFYDQETVIETWTVTSDCVSPIECTGVVHSDRGWTGTARLNDFWYIDHDIPDWVPCPDGTFAPGHQKFILWGVDPFTNGRLTTNMQLLAGRNLTKSASGACGVNKPVVIELPVRVEKLS
ncbi:Rv2253/PknI dimerization domain-containing protein [Mycolicibacterium sp. XJ1819]